MALYKRDIVRGLFYDLLAEFIEESLTGFAPIKNYLPIPDHSILEVDYAFTAFAKPFYLFGVKDSAKARLATIAFLEMQQEGLPFHGMVVHEDLSALSKRDLWHITSASDKQFSSLLDFKDKAANYMLREEAKVA